jgi:hypothetical protein
LDAVLGFFGEESADVPAAAVAHFLVAAATFTPAAREQAVAAGLEQQRLASGRLQGLAGAAAWRDMPPGAGLQQTLQMPSARKRKRKE